MAGKAMVSREGNDWYYTWADGSQDGKEGPFKTMEQAVIAAKQDGFKVANSRACNSTNPVVANAIKASGGVARNAEYKDFGQDIKVEIDDDGSCFFQISLNGLVSPYGKSWNECKPKVMMTIKTLERKAEQLKQAVAWVEKNAK